MSVSKDSHTVGEWVREHGLQPRALTVGQLPTFTGYCPPDLVKDSERPYGIECRCRSPIGDRVCR